MCVRLFKRFQSILNISSLTYNIEKAAQKYDGRVGIPRVQCRLKFGHKFFFLSFWLFWNSVDQQGSCTKRRPITSMNNPKAEAAPRFKKRRNVSYLVIC